MENLRHRRRANTQTIQRKKRKPTESLHRPIPETSGRVGSFFKTLAVLAFLAIIAYAGYKYLFPVIQQKLPSLHFTKTSNTQLPAAQSGQNQPALPVNTKPAPEPPAQTDESVPRESTSKEIYMRATQVEILNGCGESGVAKTLAEKLIARKYDVVNTGNYLKAGKRYFNVKKTKIIDQINTEKSRKKTKELAKILGISKKQIQYFSNPNPVADITIIIGKDYKSLNIFKRK
jgi:hypothetical protein